MTRSVYTLHILDLKCLVFSRHQTAGMIGSLHWFGAIEVSGAKHKVWISNHSSLPLAGLGIAVVQAYIWAWLQHEQVRTITAEEVRKNLFQLCGNVWKLYVGIRGGSFTIISDSFCSLGRCRNISAHRLAIEITNT